MKRIKLSRERGNVMVFSVPEVRQVARQERQLSHGFVLRLGEEWELS